MLVILYAVLTVWETAPLVNHANSAIMGYLDAPILGPWNAWWTRHALFDLHQNPYFTDYILYPFGVNLALHTYTFVTGLLTALTVPFLGTTLGFNAIILVGFVATGLGGALFARYELSLDWGPAAFVGTAVTFTANVGAHLTHGHYNLTTLWAITWCFYAFSRALRERSWRWSIAAGVFAGVQGLQDLYLLSVLGIALVIYLLGTAFWRQEKAWRRRFVQLGLFAGAALVVFLPEAIALWAERAEVGSLGQDLESASEFSPDLVTYVVPGWLNPFFAAVTAPIADQLHYLDVPKEVYLGWTVLVLAALALAWGGGRERALRPFWLIAGCFFLLSLGPYLHAFGTTKFAGIGPVPLPYSWFHALPLIGLARTPGNNVVMASFGLAIVGGWALQRFALRWPATGIAIALIAIALVAMETKTEIPLTGAVDRPMFDWLRSQGPGVLMEVPSGLRDGRVGFGDPQGFVQSDQVFHQQQIFGGFVARIPDGVFKEYRSDRVLTYFADPEQAPQPPGETTLARLRELHVRYVLVYDGGYAAKVRDYLTNSVGLVMLRQEPGLWLYGIPAVAG